MTTSDKHNRVSGPTAWTRMATLIIDYCVKQGANKTALLSASGIADAELTDLDGRIPLLALYSLVEAASDGDPYFGLHFTTSLRIEDLDALGFMMVTSADFGSALERMFRYQRMWAEGERFDVIHDENVVRVTYEQFGPQRPAHVQMAQMALVDFVVNGSRFIPGLSFQSVHFKHIPTNRSEYERVFPVPVQFGAGVDEVRFDESLLRHPMPDSNEALCAFFDRYTRDKLSQIPGEVSIVARVREQIRKQLPDGNVKLDVIASLLHMSGRTLQRRLREEGTSLQGELDEVRRQQALYFLSAGVAIAELSWLLGYSEPSVFHRAFRRWTDTSPEAWRHAHRQVIETSTP